MTILDDIKGIVGEFRSGLAELAQQDQVRIAEAQNLRRTIARQAETIDEQRELIADQRKAIDKLNECKPEWIPSIAALLGLPYAPDFFAVRQAIEALIKERDQLRAQLDHAALQLGERLESGLASTATPGEQIRQALADIGRSEGSIEMPGIAVHPSHLTDVLTSAEDDRREALAHVRTLLGILDATGGFMPPDYQDAIRAAREAVAR